MAKLTFNNTQALEKGLELFIKDAESKADVQELYEYISDDPERYNGIFKLFFLNSYLHEYYDAGTILDMLISIYYTYKIKDGKELLHQFRTLFNKVFNEWVAIFPLDYNTIFSKPLTSLQFKRFGKKVLVIPPTKDFKLLRALLAKEYKGLDSRESFDDFQRRNRSTLINNPLLCIRFHGARDVVLGQTLKPYRYFKWLQEVFVASVGGREEMFNANQVMTEHFYLLNLKQGELESYPLREGSKCLLRLSDEFFTFLKKMHMVFFIELIFKKTEDKFFSRIFNSLYFFSKGFNSTDKLSRFVFYVFSMESLFTMRGAPIAASLAENIALLCYPAPKRLEVYKLIKQIYSYRSDIVHSGKHNVDTELLNKTEAIASLAIVGSLNWFRLSKKEPDLEKIFFDYLLSEKLK